MKKIAVSVICLVMCCTFLCQYVSASTRQTNFICDSLILRELRMYTTSGAISSRVTKNLSGSMQSENSFLFDLSDSYIVFAESSLSTYNLGFVFDFYGSWTNDPGDNELLYFTFRFSYGQDVNLDFDQLLSIPIELVILSNSGEMIHLRDFALARETDTSYLMTWMLNVSDIPADFDIVNDVQRYTVVAPFEPIFVNNYDSGVAVQISSATVNVYFEITYQLPADYYDALILDSVEQGLDLLNVVIQNQNTSIQEIIATREVIEQLPSELRDLVVGNDYDKSLDTSDLAAYESDLNQVLQEVDVDQVVDLMNGGISLNQDGLYNEQSFDSVSDFMVQIINSTGLMPLIILTLTLGLACFIIGRSGKL